MTDTRLLGLYEQRHESAIAETAKQYGSYCTAISMNILGNREDAEEIVNDAYLAAWNAIPPSRPPVFSSFIGRIVRNLSLNRYKASRTQKRGGQEIALLFSELENCIPDVGNVESQVEVNDLMREIDEFLSTIREEDMIFFMRRYFYNDSVPQIVKQFNASEGKVTMSLHRTRKKLKSHLEKRGVSL
jgi:RNA polymerase sigma-70 factor (ECF subfamily)